jgi:hypothetical protein
MVNNGKCRIAYRVAQGLSRAEGLNGINGVIHLAAVAETIRTRILSGLDLEARDAIDSALCRAYRIKSGLSDDGWTGSEAPPLSSSAPYGRHFRRLQQVIQAHGATGVDNDHIGYG